MFLVIPIEFRSSYHHTEHYNTNVYNFTISNIKWQEPVFWPLKYISVERIVW